MFHQINWLNHYIDRTSFPGALSVPNMNLKTFKICILNKNLYIKFRKTNLKTLDFKIIFLFLPHRIILCLLSFSIYVSISTSVSKSSSFPCAFLIMIFNHNDGSDKEALRCAKFRVMFQN